MTEVEDGTIPYVVVKVKEPSVLCYVGRDRVRPVSTPVVTVLLRRKSEKWSRQLYSPAIDASLRFV